MLKPTFAVSGKTHFKYLFDESESTAAEAAVLTTIKGYARFN